MPDFIYPASLNQASLIALLVKNPLCMQCRRPQFNSWAGKSHWRRHRLPTPIFMGFPCGSAGQESACNAGDLGLIPGLGRYPGEGKGYSSILAWRIPGTVERESDTTERLSLSLFTFTMSCARKSLRALSLYFYPLTLHPRMNLSPYKITFLSWLSSFSSVQLSSVRLFATPWTAALQASLSITNSRS